MRTGESILVVTIAIERSKRCKSTIIANSTQRCISDAAAQHLEVHTEYSRQLLDGQLLGAILQPPIQQHTNQAGRCGTVFALQVWQNGLSASLKASARVKRVMQSSTVLGAAPSAVFMMSSDTSWKGSVRIDTLPQVEHLTDDWNTTVCQKANRPE